MTDEPVIGGRYVVGKLIGKGSFGQIYAGRDRIEGVEVAVKCESLRNRRQTLPFEARVLKEMQGVEGVPTLHWVGVTETDNVLVMDLCGPSLEELFAAAERKMSIKTVLEIGQQIVQRVEAMHNRHYVHRDIKPENFLTGLSSHSDTVHLIDFGLAKRFRDPVSLQHLPFKEGMSLTGTARYASIHAHKGNEQGRRDDMESIVYVLLYFLKGALPWQGLLAKSKQEKYRRILDMKTGIPVDRLCESVPFELSQLLSYTRSLKYEDQPDYSLFNRLFRQVAAREQITFDRSFDWTPHKKRRSHSQSGSDGRRKSISHRRRRDSQLFNSNVPLKPPEQVEDEAVPTARGQCYWPQLTQRTRMLIAADRNPGGQRKDFDLTKCTVF